MAKRSFGGALCQTKKPSARSSAIARARNPEIRKGKLYIRRKTQGQIFCEKKPVATPHSLTSGTISGAFDLPRRGIKAALISFQTIAVTL